MIKRKKKRKHTNVVVAKGKHWRFKIVDGVIYLTHRLPCRDEVELVFYSSKTFDDFVQGRI